MANMSTPVPATSDYGDNTPVKGELQDVTFRPAKGGLISETSHKVKGGKFGPDYKRETAVHGSLGHAMRHMKDVFGSGGGSPAKKKREKGASMRKG